MSQPQAPRGTRDFGPDEMALRRLAEAEMRRVMQRHGFQEVQTPTFEHLDLFTAKSGDGIVSELYDFADKGGRRLALRPELTAPVMRYYHNALTVAPKPIKLYYFGNCFRYDRPQKGRYREFWQLGCELVGPDTPEAVAEVLSMGVHAITAVGVKELVVRLGHLDVLHGCLALAGWPSGRDAAAVLRAIDKWDEPAVRNGLAEAGVEEPGLEWFVSLRDANTIERLAEVEAAAPELGDSASRDRVRAALERLAAVVEGLASLGVDQSMVRIDPLIARGLDYYTGVVFEIDAPALGAEKQLLGGGQYDLSGVFGADPVPTCGFGLGFDRALVAREASGAAPPPPPSLDVFVAPIGDAARRAGLALAHALRRAGLLVEVDLMRRNPGKNLKAASTRGARYAVLLGDKELAAGTVVLKNMESGEQTEHPADGLPAHLAGKTGA